MIKVSFFIFLFVSWAWPSDALEWQVYAYAQPHQVKVGEALQIQIVIHHHEQEHVQIPSYVPGTEYQGLLVGLENEHSYQTKQKDGDNCTQVILTFRAFQPGIYCFPSQSICLVGEKETRTVSTNPVYVAFTDQQGQPALPVCNLQEQFSSSYPSYSSISILLYLAALLAAISGWRWWKERVPHSSPLPLPPSDPWEFEILQSLESGLTYLPCSLASKVLLFQLRKYLGRKWNVLVLPQSITELQPLLQEKLDVAQQQKLLHCIQTLEQFQYGLSIPTSENLAPCFLSIFDLICQNADGNHPRWNERLAAFQQKYLAYTQAKTATT